MMPVPGARERNNEPAPSRTDNATRPSHREVSRQPQIGQRTAGQPGEPARADRSPRAEDARRSVGRERSGAGDTSPQTRKPKGEPSGQDISLFDGLLDNPAVPQPIAGLTLPGISGMATGTAHQPQPASPPVTLWQQLEPQLCSALDKQPAGPLSMTLLLPKLGEVDARISPLAAGWDISLRFSAGAMAMLAPHQERCRESLRRRMACQVKLRFEQRGDRE